MVDMKELKKESEFLIDNVGFAVSTNQGDYIEALTAQLNEAEQHLIWLKKTAVDSMDNCRIVGFEDCLNIWRGIVKAALNQQEEKI